MKIYDQGTRKEYTCENDYDYQIRKFRDDQQCLFFDNEVIDFAFALRDELINDLEGKDDTIRLKYIKWIEDRYLLYTKDYLILHSFSIPERLVGFKSFKYKGYKKVNRGGRPTGKSRQTILRHNYIMEKFTRYKERFTDTQEEIAASIHSELAKNRPPFWTGNIYKKSTILKVIKNKLWGDS